MSAAWDLEGMIVTATYLDEFTVTGEVVTSRVSYGGEVKHTIQLNNPINVYGAKRTRVIVSMRDIHRVMTNE